MQMTITDSVIPLIAEAEKVANLHPAKYSQKQFEKIVQALQGEKNRIRLVSYNMLFNIRDNELNEQDRWQNRYPRLLQLIQWMQPDILCSQELHRDQLNDLLPEMKQTYLFYGEENKTEGEIDGIFVRRDRFDVINVKVWLIAPELPNSYPHNLLHLELCDKLTKTHFSVFNTHLPYLSADEREYSAKFVQERAEEMSGQMAVFLAGDLNTIPHRMDMPDLPFYDGDYIQQIISQGSLRDTMAQAILGHLGPIATFTTNPASKIANPFEGEGVPGVILDHIFSNSAPVILIHAIEPAKVDGHFPSDHMPVIIDFLLK